jgi:hypothetical protein
MLWNYEVDGDYKEWVGVLLYIPEFSGSNFGLGRAILT